MHEPAEKGASRDRTRRLAGLIFPRETSFSLPVISDFDYDTLENLIF